jgi:small subunit ribosomal protein S1
MAPHGNYLFDQEILSSSAAQRDKFAELLDGKYNYAFKKGEIIAGTVITVDAHHIYVDIGAKTTAVLHSKEMAVSGHGDEPVEPLKPGDTSEFYILREEDEDGQLTLSQRRVTQAYTWKKLQLQMDGDETIQCKVMAIVKGGLLVDVQSLRGFVPSSHIRVRGTFEELIGETLPFKILAIDQNRNNIILSHRKVMADQVAEQRKDLFGNLEVGSVIEGDVVRITDFGAFVDLGGVDGLLPLSQMSWRWVEHPSDVLAIGDKVKVEIIGVDADRQRVSLSVKSQQSDPWDAVATQFQQGDQIDGTVTRIKQFGAFVEIYPGVEALLPSKELQDYEHDNNEAITPHQHIQVYIHKFNPEERRISLGFRQPQEYGHGGGGYVPEPFDNEPDNR